MKPKIGTMFRVLPDTKNVLVAVTEIDKSAYTLEDSYGKRYKLPDEELQKALTEGRLVEESSSAL
jgi:hypothetical protein